MNIVKYNILDGCCDLERFERLSRWFYRKNYDIAGFNKLNGWTDEKSARYGTKWGFPHHYIFKMQSSPYRIGVMSKFPIELIECKETPFYHGLFYVKIHDSCYDYVSLTGRFRTSRKRNEAYCAVGPKDEPLVVMGDLNTLSPYDGEHYERTGISVLLVGDEKLTRKFLAGGSINYRPMLILLEVGLMDAGLGRSFQHSVPTPVIRDEMHTAKLRLDYILVNRSQTSEPHQVDGWIIF